VQHRYEIGRIGRVQVQISSLKSGPPNGRYYDPAPLREVEWLEMNHDGVTAIVDGEHVVDVHNATHPATKNRDGINPISIGFTSHYDRMRERFDGHLVNGIAGESILVETDTPVELDIVAGGFTIECADGRSIDLVDVSVAHPCVEFSRFALNDRAAPPLVVSEALRFLDNGLRGYYATVQSTEPIRVEPGDRVFAIRQR